MSFRFASAARRALAVIACVVSIAPVASAATLTWTGAVSVNWSNGGNWDTGNAPVTGDDVILASTARDPSQHDLVSVALKSITVSSQPSFAINGNPIALQSGGSITDNAATGTFFNTKIVLNGPATLAGASVYNDVISGTGPLTFVANGFNNMLILEANTYSGATVIGSTGGGVVVLEPAGAIPAGSAVTVMAGGNFAIASDQVFGSLAGSGSVDLFGQLTVGGDGTTTIFSGTLSGTGSLVKAGAGTFILSGTNTFSGSLTALGGALTVASSGSIPANCAVTAVATVNVLANATFGSLEGNGAVFIGPGITWTIGANNASTMFLGVIKETAPAGALTKVGTGTLTLAAPHTYTGPTIVNGGVLQLTGSIPSNVAVNGGGVLGGSGIINGTLGVFSGGTLAPGITFSHSTAHSGNLVLDTGATLQMHIAGVGTQDQVSVTGSVTLANPTLGLSALAMPQGSVTTLISNDAGDPVIGTFNGLPEGSLVTSGSNHFTISYVGGDGNDVTLTAVVAPAAPTALNAVGGNAQATVGFTAPVSNGGSAITGYTVTSIPPGGVDSNAGSMATSHLITGLVNGTAYTFTVVATNLAGPSVASAPSNSVTPAGLPGAPVIGVATPGNGQATIAFAAAAANGSAIIGYTATCNPGGISAPGAAAATSIVVPSLANSTPYICSVRATNGIGIGPPSGTVGVTPARTSISASSPTGTGTISASFTGGGAACTFTTSQFIPLTGNPASPPGPAPADFPHGLFDFTLGGCTPGSTITMTIVYPSALPAGTQYWKFGPTPTTPGAHWYLLPATIAGNTVTFSITDGGLGDDDLAANGAIVDQGGPGVPGAPGTPTSIPTLNEWALLLMGLLLMSSGLFYARHRRLM